MIQTLINALPRFIDQNNEIYYNCFGDGSIQAVETGSVVVYIVRGESLPAYLQDSYNYSNSTIDLSG